MNYQDSAIGVEKPAHLILPIALPIADFARREAARVLDAACGSTDKHERHL
jgi:hypothetical protein